MACQETTVERLECEKPTSVHMESEAGHREVPKEGAVVKPVKERKKQQRGRKLTAGRGGEPKELSRGICGSRKLAATCRKVSHRATVAWRKRNIFRKIRTQGNCGPQKGLAAAGRKIILCAKVSRRKGHRRKERHKDDVAPRSTKGRTLEKRQRSRKEGGKGPRRETAAMSEEDQDNHERHRRVELWTKSHLVSGGTRKKTLFEIYRRKILRQVVGNSRGFRRIKNWTLRKGRPPPKRKQKQR
jgi:hypothetical protein